jgi:hypothetical protein
MRLVVLLTVLASACDQGATATTSPPETIGQPLQAAPPPPPFVRFEVRDDADFIAKAIILIEDLGELFADGNLDCELVATRVENWGAENVTRFGVLTDYSKAHPEATQALTKQFESRATAMIQKMTPVLTSCSSNQRMMSVFQKLASQSEQIQQRPR